MKIDRGFGIWYHGAAYHLVNIECTMRGSNLHVEGTIDREVRDRLADHMRRDGDLAQADRLKEWSL